MTQAMYYCRVCEMGHAYANDPHARAQPGVKHDQDKYENATLNDREKTHGDYEYTASIAQQFKHIVDQYGDNLRPCQAESLDMICTKIARILSGDPNHKDSWIDIAGYANLVSERLK